MTGLKVDPGRERSEMCSTRKGHTLRSPGGQGGLSPRGHTGAGPGLSELDQPRDLVHIMEDHSRSAIARILVLSKAGGKRKIFSLSHRLCCFYPSLCVMTGSPGKFLTADKWSAVRWGSICVWYWWLVSGYDSPSRWATQLSFSSGKKPRKKSSRSWATTLLNLNFST